MDSSVSPKDEIWFLRVCHHISNAVCLHIRRQLGGHHWRAESFGEGENFSPCMNSSPPDRPAGSEQLHPFSVLYTLSQNERFYCVTSYLTEKLSKLRSFEGNSASLRTVLSSRLSHEELCSSLKESHSFLSLPPDTTMASFQGTSVSSNSFSR